MIQTKKTIPALTVAAFALAGCGDDDPSVVAAFCGKAVECEDSDWVDLEDCLNDLSGGTVDDACGEAYVALYRCYSTLDCESFGFGPFDNKGGPEECADEFDTVVDDCDF